MFCRKCGSQLEDGSRFCSHCGASVDPTMQPSAPTQQNYAQPQQQSYYAPQPQQVYAQPQQQQSTETNIYAILGFIFSFLIAIVGLILSIMGLQKPQLQGLAVAGIIISVISMVLALIVIITF